MVSEKITYIKYCPNVFLAKCEAQHEKGEIINVETRRGDLHECEVHNFIGRTKDGCYAYSITRTDGTNKATVAARRAERRRDWAQKAEERSSRYFEKSEAAVSGIVPGQPILVGHHSEKRHRAAIELYRRAYLLFGNMLELRDMMIENDRMEADADDLEKVGNELIDTLRRIVGLSAVTDQEQELENVPSDLLEAIKEKQQ